MSEATTTNTETTEAMSISDQVAEFTDYVLSQPLRNAIIFGAGALVMRRVDTGAIKKAVGEKGYAEVKKALPFGGIPLINA